MKRILIVILIISTLLITGCKSSKKEENEFKRVINTYYENYVKNKVEGLDVLEVSLDDLRDLNDNNIDLSKLKKCSGDSKVSATIKGNKLTEYEFDLNC